MTRDEAKQIVLRIRSLYISQARNLTPADWQTMIDTWAEQFKDDPYEDVNKAVSLYVNKGKQFMPSAPDIINELINIDEPQTRALFERLKRECDKLVNGAEHVVIDDLGGIRRDPTSPTGWRYVTAEAHITTNYTQADFAAMPIELQMYAEDIEGLRALDKEIKSNDFYAYRRFKDRLTYIRSDMKGTDNG